MKLKWQRNVHELFSSYSRSYEDLYMKHKIREIPEAEWELACMAPRALTSGLRAPSDSEPPLIAGPIPRKRAAMDDDRRVRGGA